MSDAANRVPVRRPAPTDVPVHPLIGGRWSPRAISPEPVDPAVLRRVFEAARWAPSSFNEQPWRFLVATSDDEVWIERLRSYLSDGNAWARNAPVLVATAYRTTLSRNDRPNRVALRDLGSAEENAFLQVVAEGLVMHQMAGFDHGRLADELLPAGFDPGTMWAIGHPGDPEDLPESKRDSERAARKRKPLEETVFGPAWEEPASFLEKGVDKGRRP